MHGMELIGGPGITISSTGNQVYVSTEPAYDTNNGRFISVQDMLHMIEVLRARIDLLEINIAKHDQFPALKAAYDNYRTIERLCDSTDETE